MTAQQHIAAILAWLSSDAVLTPEERAEYAQRLASYRKTPQNELPLCAAKEKDQ